MAEKVIKYISCGGEPEVGSAVIVEAPPLTDAAGRPSILRLAEAAVRVHRAGPSRTPVHVGGRNACLAVAAYLTSFEGLSPWEAAVWAGRPGIADVLRSVTAFIDFLGLDGAEAVTVVGERLGFGVGHARASKAVSDAVALIDLLSGVIPDRAGWAPLALAGAALMEIGLPYGVKGHEVRSAALAKSAPEIMAGLGPESAEGLYYAIKYHIPGSGDPRDDPEAPESIAWEAAVASAVLKVAAVTSNYPDPVDAAIDPPNLRIGVGPESPPHLLKAAEHLARLAGLSPAPLSRSWGSRLSS